LVCRSILTLPRSLHELIWGLLLVNIWGLDPLTGIIAIAIPYGAIVGKVFSEILDETPSANCLALTNSGVKPWTAFAYSIIPQAYLNLLSYSFYRFECSLRSATVLGIIGAGGLGYQIYLSLQSLRYQELWTLFYALIFLNGLVDVSSNWLRRRLGCVSRLDLNAGKLTSSRKVNINNNFIFLGLNFSWLILVLSCFCYLQPDLTKIWHSQTLNNLQQLFSLAFPPTLSPETMGQLFNLTSQTLAMSILAITLAGIGGIIISFPAANNFSLMGVHHFKKSPLAWLCLITCRLFLLLCRAIPSPIWALIALFVLFPGILPGSLALGIHNLGILGRLMAEVNENLEKAPLQALQAQGTPPASVVIYGVLPLTLNKFIAYILYRWEVCMRETVIVGLVGAGGLGKLLTEQLSSFDYAGVAATLICFIFLTFMVDRISAIVRSQTYL
ncbi:MAG: ABC transporter permease subunit, partial [Cyanobacteria bacterium J083]